MRNATKQLNTPIWHRRRADKLSADRLRRPQIDGRGSAAWLAQDSKLKS